MEEMVIMLEDYAKLEPKCLKSFSVLKNKETSFGWEEPLVKLLNYQ
jgi:hypothetical protein